MPKGDIGKFINELAKTVPGTQLEKLEKLVNEITIVNVVLFPDYENAVMAYDDALAKVKDLASSSSSQSDKDDAEKAFWTAEDDKKRAETQLTSFLSNFFNGNLDLTSKSASGILRKLDREKFKEYLDTEYSPDARKKLVADINIALGRSIKSVKRSDKTPLDLSEAITNLFVYLIDKCADSKKPKTAAVQKRKTQNEQSIIL